VNILGVAIFGDGAIPVKRLFPWLISNADTMLALIISVLISLLIIAGVVSSTLINGAITATLAVLAFTLLHDRRLQEKSREQIRRLEDKVDIHNPIRYLTGNAINRAILNARSNTDQWLFRGSTATYVRVAVLPDCVKRAHRTGNEFRMRLEILDPTSTIACDNYIQLYRSLAENSQSPEMSWTPKGTMIELYATILAVCWYKQRYKSSFSAEIGLSATASTFRWEASSHYFILTQRGPRFPAMLIGKEEPFYRLLVLELNANFHQARKLNLELADDIKLSDEPTIEETRSLFSQIKIELSADFNDKDVSAIVAKALHDENPYETIASEV
jgi:hypothetical protein